MNRKILALILALVAVAAAIVLTVSLNDHTPIAGDPGAETTDTAPSTPGVEDSIFDEESAQTQEPAATDAPGSTEEPDVNDCVTPAPEDDIPIPDGTVSPESSLQNPNTQTPGTAQPSETEPGVTEPAQTEPDKVPEGEIDYETFVAMDPALQRVYMESFESMDAFFDWYNAAKEAYEQAHPSIDVGDGIIDLEELVGQEP